MIWACREGGNRKGTAPRGCPLGPTTRRAKASKLVPGASSCSSPANFAHGPYAPAAALIAGTLAAECDFFSIGTNDLTQYAVAADRTNARVAPLADALHPAILRLVHQTVQTGHAAGIWVGLCGELAGDPLAAPVLLGLELDELSMSPPAIPAVKQAVSRVRLTEARALAKTVLNLDTAEAVRQEIKDRFPGGTASPE